MNKNRVIVYLLFLGVCIGCTVRLTQRKTINNTGEKKGNTGDFAEKYSKVYGIPIGNSDEQRLIEEIANWLGTPYLYAGNTQKGTDCSGFTQQVYQRVYHKPLQRTADGMYNECKKLRKNELKQGDLVFFKINTPKVGHVGIYLKEGYFAHASTARGVIVSSLTESYYNKYFHAGGRVK